MVVRWRVLIRGCLFRRVVKSVPFAQLIVFTGPRQALGMCIIPTTPTTYLHRLCALSIALSLCILPSHSPLQLIPPLSPVPSLSHSFLPPGPVWMEEVNCPPPHPLAILDRRCRGDSGHNHTSTR